ncbi:MAG: nitroreductase family protein [Anaerolineae bacterium]|nr:nitroreductase family protein [Anaerolineae bacterium]MDW8072237.1 nitroreductase family protein [Anaerolineae bacterium]
MLPRLSLFDFVRAIVRILSARPRVPPAVQGNRLLETILRRRSIRSFSRREIPDEVFAAILEAGRLAPSTVNLQTWAFAVFTAQSWKAFFGRSIPFNGQRAVIVLGDAHWNRTIAEMFADSPLVSYTVAVINASLAAMSMSLAAEALGVSSVMLSETGRTGFLDAGYLKEKLALPDGVFPLMTIVFGYARGPYPPMPPKLPLEQICFTGLYRGVTPAVAEDWLKQMIAGYKAAYPLSSFERQLQIYRMKIDRAERDLTAMVFHRR